MDSLFEDATPPPNQANLTSKALRMTWTVGVGALIIAILVVGTLLYATRIPSLFKSARSGPSELARALFEDQTGVRIVRVALTAGGGMIDLRYQVIDPNKAVIVHDRKNPLMVIDETSGRELSKPWMDHSHSGALNPGVTYYTLLMNSGGVLKRDSRVTVVIGGVRLEGVPVE